MVVREQEGLWVSRLGLVPTSVTHGCKQNPIIFFSEFDYCFKFKCENKTEISNLSLLLIWLGIVFFY